MRVCSCNLIVLYQRILYKLIRSYGRRSESENESSVEREPRAVPARRTTDDARAAARTTARTVPAPMALHSVTGDCSVSMSVTVSLNLTSTESESSSLLAARCSQWSSLSAESSPRQSGQSECRTSPGVCSVSLVSTRGWLLPVRSGRLGTAHGSLRAAQDQNQRTRRSSSMLYQYPAANIRGLPTASDHWARGQTRRIERSPPRERRSQLARTARHQCEEDV